MDDATYYARLGKFNNECEKLGVELVDKSHLEQERFSVPIALSNLLAEFQDLQSLATWPPI